MKTLLLSTLLALAFAPHLMRAEIKTETVEYKLGDTTFEGAVAFDDASKDKRPGVLIIHDWMGVTDYTRSIAQEIAKMGYVAFAADIYGKGVRPADAQAASAEAGKYKSDRKLLRERVTAGFAQLTKHELVDGKKCVAIGYCFGGTTVLELARSGADIAGVVSFHGGLDSLTPEDAKQIKAKVLVLHGADDPFVKTPDIAAFQEELRKAGVDWQMVYYGNAVHSFTKKAAGNDKSKGNAYHEPSARRSWEAMKAFFDEIF